MFNGSDLDILIEALDRNVKKYSVLFSDEKESFDKQTNNIAFLANERTVASALNTIAFLYLRKIGYEPSLCVNEFPIRFNNGIKSSAFSKLRMEAGGVKVRKNGWKTCYVDGYFKIPNILINDTVTHVFAEYKMNNVFVYLDLANDYLKYKAYTFNNEENTVFIYVICNKKDDYPSILNSSRPRFERISKSISKSSITKDGKVFVYLGSKNSNGEDTLDEAIDKVDSISKLATLINEYQNENHSKITEEDLAFIELMQKFNSRVITSETMKKHYPFITQVWDKSNEMHLFDNIKDVFGVNSEDELTPHLIISEGAFYKENLSDFISADDKVAARIKGIRGSTHLSLFLVSIIDYFNQYFNVGVDNPEYEIRHLRKTTKKIDIKQEDVVKYFKECLDNHWFGDPDKINKLKKIAFSLMYYVVHLYPIIFDIDEKTGKVLDYILEYQNYKAINELQSKINALIKWLKCEKQYEISVDSLLNNDEEALDNLVGLVDFITKKY